ALVLLLFSVVFPAAKLVLAAYVWRTCAVADRRLATSLAALDWIGRWSMLDVLVIALLSISIKSSGVADARAQPGLYLFAGSILLSMLGFAWLKAVIARHRAVADRPR